MSDETPTAAQRPLWKRVLPIAIAVGIVVVIFGWVLPQFIDYEAVWRGIGRLDGLEWAILVLATALWVVPEAWVYVASQPGLALRQGAMMFFVVNTLVNVPPGGLDLVARYQMTRSWGYPPSSATSGTLISWVAGTAGKLIMPLLAVLVLAAYNLSDGVVDLAALLSLVAFVVVAGFLGLVLRSPELALRVGQGLGRAVRWLAARFGRTSTFDFGAMVQRFREQSADVLRARWHVTVASGLSAQLAMFLVLFLTLRFIGVDSEQLAWPIAFAVFALVAMLNAIPIFGVPGIAEALYIGAFTAVAGRESADLIAAAVFVFRVLTWLAPIAGGGFAYNRWRATLRKQGGAPLAPAEEAGGA